jgi:hypothetical protein
VLSRSQVIETNLVPKTDALEFGTPLEDASGSEVFQKASYALEHCSPLTIAHTTDASQKSSLFQDSAARPYEFPVTFRIGNQV